jgi:hypothetical protein
LGEVAKLMASVSLGDCGLIWQELIAGQQIECFGAG